MSSLDPLANFATSPEQSNAQKLASLERRVGMLERGAGSAQASFAEDPAEITTNPTLIAGPEVALNLTSRRLVNIYFRCDCKNVGGSGLEALVSLAVSLNGAGFVVSRQMLSTVAGGYETRYTSGHSESTVGVGGGAGGTPLVLLFDPGLYVFRCAYRALGGGDGFWQNRLLAAWL